MKNIKINAVGEIHTMNDVLKVYPKALDTKAATDVFTTMTSMTDASNISTWVHKKWTCISIPMLDKKRAAKRFRIGSICKHKSHSHMILKW